MEVTINSPISATFVANQQTATERADACFKFICRYIIEHGSLDRDPRPIYASDGAEAHAFSVNHVIQRFDLTKGDFPLLSIRNTAVKSGVGEILWIYKDQSNDLKKLAEYGVTWWDKWDIGDGTIGQCYGKTVKDHKIIDTLLSDLKSNPDSRRHIIDLYQYDDFTKKHGLKPCALYSEYNVRYEGDKTYLDSLLLLRSSDYIMAGAINQAQYIALFQAIAQINGFIPGVFTCILVNCQIYDRHVDPVKEMLERKSIPANPHFNINTEGKSFFDLQLSDFVVEDYPRKEINTINPNFNLDIGVWLPHKRGVYLFNTLHFFIKKS